MSGTESELSGGTDVGTSSGWDKVVVDAIEVATVVVEIVEETNP